MEDMEEWSRHALAVRMAELARAVATPRTVDQILAEVTAMAVEIIPGADTAGVLLIGDGGTFDSLGGTSDLPHTLDELQMTFHEGPCVAAALEEVVVRTEDFDKESRWPNYSKAAAELGVRSGLSVKLYTADRTAGALNLFGFQPAAWDAESETIASVLAAHAAASLLAGKHSEQLNSALASRDRIGQAKGMIMERFKVDDVQAFEMLKRLSQDSNSKLIDIAEQVIDSRD